MSIGIKAKRFVRKIAAITIGAAFIGATIGGALATTYSVAPAADKVAGTKLATGSVTGDKITKEIGIGGSLVTTTQPEDYFDNPLEDDDLAILQDTTLSYNDGNGYDDYEVSDQIWFGANSPSIETSLSTANVDKDYKSDVAMEVAADSIYYYYGFDEAINITDVSEENPVELKFLGKHFEVTGVSWVGAVANAIAVKIGETHYLNIGDEITVEGHKLKLEDVGDEKVAVSLDGGAIITINADAGHSWPEGLEVEVDSVFYKSGDPTQSTANLLVGADATKTYRDGDEFLGEAENNEYWRWDINHLEGGDGLITTVTAAGTATGPVLGLQNYFVVDDSSDVDPAPVKNSGCYDVSQKDPYMQVCIDGLSVSDTEYITVDIEPALVDLRDAGGEYGGCTSAPVLKIKSNVKDSFKLHRNDNTAAGTAFGPVDAGIVGTAGYITNDVSTNEVYLFVNDTIAGLNMPTYEVFYIDTDNDVAIAGNITTDVASTDYNGSFMYIDYLDTKSSDVQFWLSTAGEAGIGAVHLNITSIGAELPGANWADNLSIRLGNSTTWVANCVAGHGEIDQIGLISNVEEALDLTYRAEDATYKQLGLQDEDLRTDYGIIVKNPKAMTQDDQVQLLIPGDAVRAKVTVGAYGAIGQALVDEAKLDTEVTTVPAGSILVGGPAANKYAADAMGKTFPTYGADLGWEDGWCYIKELTLKGAAVTVIAGWDASDTEACVDAYIKGTKSNDGKLAA